MNKLKIIDTEYLKILRTTSLNPKFSGSCKIK